ncbi:hypothetical protein CUJ88_32875 [Paraburkholderia hospita]|uniref:HAD domain-containing protein n=1 Tax=Paraburkholderia TaxID=1822464 RepID=UPI000557897B|nr:hypothetical protein CUJ88_32875 [Paraburkholderia hospita]OUL89358.1 hypothetical protein CA603_19290 [Paraburkholderia hospita]
MLEGLLGEYPAVRIIVSSDWRRLFDDATLIRLLGPLGDRFLGVVESYGSCRSAEILAEVRRRRITHWLAVDDHPSVVAAQKEEHRFISCNASTGLSEIAVQRKLNEMLSAFPENVVG